jgi:hypothetical protein
MRPFVVIANKYYWGAQLRRNDGLKKSFDRPYAEKRK